VSGPETVRAFLALEIPEETKRRLAEAQGHLRRDLPRARWTRPEGQHLTLKFLGEVSPSVLATLTADLAPRLEGLEPVVVRFRGAGFFPSPQRPRVAWVGGSAEGAEPVVAAVEDAAASAGFDRERRPWSLHLTQARLKASWPRSAVSRFLQWGDALDLGPFSCREVVLFQSQLQAAGAVYTALERMPLE
jgi:2'-5' RNA ligase